MSDFDSITTAPIASAKRGSLNNKVQARLECTGLLIWMVLALCFSELPTPDMGTVQGLAQVLRIAVWRVRFVFQRRDQ